MRRRNIIASLIMFGVILLGAAVLGAALRPALASVACGSAPRIGNGAARYLVIAEGDSITFGQQSTDGLGSYVPRACVLQVNRIETIVAAQSRAVLGSPADPPGANSLYGRMRADTAILAAKKGRRIAILTILIGRNDLVGYGGGSDAYADNLVKYIRTMRRAGFDRIVVGTVLPSTWGPFDRQRDDLNSILTTPGWARAHGIDAIVDFAAMPDMGRDGAAANTTYYADGIHPNNRGYAAMAPVYGRTLAALMGGAAR